MNKLIPVVFLIFCFLVSCDDLPKNNSKDRQATSRNTETDKPSNASEDIKELRYKGKKVKITKHGDCRMDCRHLDMYEVQQVLDNGKINAKKSNPSDSPCPTAALEGRTRDGQTARVVVADCDDEVRIITVIDLDNDYKCDCY